MGIESDQLVYDYLSRVGDLAQQRQLPSGARMRLVADLRKEIDRGRAGAGAGGDSPAAVRRILARLGTPEDIVDAAGGTPATPDVPTAVPPQHGEGAGSGEGGGGGQGEDVASRLRRLVPRPRRAPKAPPPQGLLDLDGPRPSPPHLAGSDELGPSGSEPDWWRLDSSPFGGADTVPGFVGGVEIPEILKPPPDPDNPPRLGKEADAKAAAEAGADAEEEEVEAAESRRRWRPRLPLPRRPGEGAGLSNPLLLLAAALLIAGAVLGNWLALGGGWLIAYASRRLSRAEAKWAVLGMPALAVAAGLTWLWGRTDGRWGDPIRDGRMSGAIGETWPWVVRGAAVASALFLVWRSQRRRP
ncbi:hypothetical protein [Streptomyces sp. NRRL S-920]|uniref:hypothetical protein n=1 Tax=Streptomyces sp. NRRL S-920 TaxID=1463921 RepID=UPI0004C71461|nr:hypothetical protein [Streptomyces sp. NRRL S-920]